MDNLPSYQEAVRALNTLQSNAAVLEKIREERDRKKHTNIPDTIKQAARAGVTLDDIDRLSIIHVSGTKGKGSTCAFCESVLRAHGYKTGFFSSPHLVEVRERIRINGRPLSRDSFSQYFWDCYKKLEATKAENNGNMPAYFRFLTIMAFHVFIKEEVDVAIVEVGIGGQYDSTNIIRHPVVCGVTSLGLDHVSLLGDTIPKIAWHKAGIFKPGMAGVTVTQPENSIDVLRQRAQEIGTPLYVAPNLEDYDWQGRAMALGIAGDMQKHNASLALQLCKIFMDNHGKSHEQRQKEGLEKCAEKAGDVVQGEHFAVSPEMATGLWTCRWPGRTDTICRPGLTYYIDGAHTPRSIQQCVKWFKEAAGKERDSIQGKTVRVLLFNTTGDRKPETLLKDILTADIDCAVFCPNIATTSTATADQTNYTVTLESQLKRCITNETAWLNLTYNKLNSIDGSGDHGALNKFQNVQEENAIIANGYKNNGHGDAKACDHRLTAAPTFTFHNIHDTLRWVSQGRDPVLKETTSELVPVPETIRNPTHIQVLCTGSLHLIGGIIGLLNADLYG